MKRFKQLYFSTRYLRQMPGALSSLSSSLSTRYGIFSTLIQRNSQEILNSPKVLNYAAFCTSSSSTSLSTGDKDGAPKKGFAMAGQYFSRIFNLKSPHSENSVYANTENIFFNCHQEASHPIWYTRGKVSTEFRSKHTMLMLHIWMVHKRLVKEAEIGGARLQELLFDYLWEDTAKRIRNLGVMEISVNKRTSEVQNYSFRFCFELDSALLKETEEEKIDAIAGALWRSLYVRNPDIPEAHVLELANYIRAEQQSLLTLPTVAVFEGSIGWSKPIEWIDRKETRGSKLRQSIASNAASKSVLTEQTVMQSDIDEDKKKKLLHAMKYGVWKEAVSDEGKIYYWNTKTRESTWTKPENVDIR